MKRLGDWTAQFRRHISRRKALGGWLIIGIAGVLTQLIKIDVFRELVLILIGVVLSYILLPDPEYDIHDAVARSSLWLARPSELRAVVPPERLKAGAYDLLKAAAPDRAKVAWEHGCRPILELDDHPDALLENLSYDIWMEPIENTPMYSVKSTIANTRLLPAGEDKLWVSFARTPEVLDKEFEARGCILRELIDIPSTVEWDALIDAHFSAELILDEDEIVYTPVVEKIGHDLVRMVFSDLPRPAQPVQTKLEARFVLPLSTRSFPVRLASYYCLGETKIEFYINDYNVERVDVAIFLTREFQHGPSGYTWQKEDTRSKAPGLAEKRSKRVKIGPDRLVWPGSGVLFSWERREDLKR